MIVVFGSINLDLVARTERLPQPGETIAGHSFAVLPGGKGANQAIAARRAGADVAMAGAVGTDLFAATALSGLTVSGVDVAWVRRDATPTGVALIHVEASGQNAITVIPGANAHVLAATVPAAALGPGTTVVLQLEVPLDAVHDIASRARQRGARVILNAAPARALPAALLAVLDVLVVNRSRPRRWRPRSTDRSAAGLRDAPCIATTIAPWSSRWGHVVCSPRRRNRVHRRGARRRRRRHHGCRRRLRRRAGGGARSRAGWPRPSRKASPPGRSHAPSPARSRAAAAAAIRPLATKVESTLIPEPTD